MDATAARAVNGGDHQGAEPVLSSALHALDDTIADLDGYTELDSTERFSDIISKEEAKQAVESKFVLNIIVDVCSQDYRFLRSAWPRIHDQFT